LAKVITDHLRPEKIPVKDLLVEIKDYAKLLQLAPGPFGSQCQRQFLRRRKKAGGNAAISPRPAQVRPHWTKLIPAWISMLSKLVPLKPLTYARR
jgi:hypothetical protein